MIERPGARTRQAAAEQWASTADEIKRAEDVARRHTTDLQNLRDRLTTLAQELQKCVGPAQTVKVFAVASGAVVIVAHERSIQLVETEAKDR